MVPFSGPHQILHSICTICLIYCKNNRYPVLCCMWQLLEDRTRMDELWQWSLKRTFIFFGHTMQWSAAFAIVKSVHLSVCREHSLLLHVSRYWNMLCTIHYNTWGVSSFLRPNFAILHLGVSPGMSALKWDTRLSTAIIRPILHHISKTVQDRR